MSRGTGVRRPGDHPVIQRQLEDVLKLAGIPDRDTRVRLPEELQTVMAMPLSERSAWVIILPRIFFTA
jgi:hypothetical protein